MTEVLSIGHSALSLGRFLELLDLTNVTAIADVRSLPWSRFNPQFNREDLKSALNQAGVAYRFYGRQLGGRPNDPSLFHHGTADYEAMARTPEFAEGIRMVLEGAKKYRLALMCSEHDPLDCHRCLLVGRALAERGSIVTHILSSGETISHNDVEENLLTLSGRESDDFFAPRPERLEAAYRDRSRKVAYTERSSESADPADLKRVYYG